MLQLIYICFIFHSSKAAYDEPKVDLIFFKNVTSNYSLLNDVHEAVINFRPIMLKRNLVEDERTERYGLYDAVTKDVLNTKVYSTLKYKYQAMLRKYETYAIKRASEKIRDIPYYMTIELHIQKDTIPPLHNFLKNFTKTARKFFDEAHKQKFLSNIDKEFSLIDTVEKFNTLLYGEELSLLNDMIFKYDVNISSDTMMIILKHFYNELIENNRADMDYICIKFNICRPNLRFTDYIGDIARELLKLSDAKLTHSLLKLSIHIKDQSVFFQSILGKTSAIEIGAKLEEMVFSDVTGIRNIFVEVLSYLARRHKFMQTTDEDVNIRNKALRILVDIVDQAFDINGDEILGMHFNIILKTIGEWSEGRNTDIEKVLKAFVMQSVGIMKINLSGEAINEIKALVDIMMEKEDRSNKIYRYLLYHGSTFVRGEDISRKLSLLL